MVIIQRVTAPNKKNLLNIIKTLEDFAAQGYHQYPGRLSSFHHFQCVASFVLVFMLHGQQMAVIVSDTMIIGEGKMGLGQSVEEW